MHRVRWDKILGELNPLQMFVLAFLAVVSGVTSYSGMTLMMGETDFWWTALAALVAAAVSALIWIFYASVFAIVPNLRHRCHKLRAAIVVLIGVALIVGISTLSSLIGMSKNANELFFDACIITQSEANLTDTKRFLFDAGLALTGVSSLADQYAAARDAEAAGQGGGGAGCGPLCRNKGSIADKLATLVLRVESDRARLAGRIETAETALADLRLLSQAPLSSTERDAARARLVGLINGVIAEIAGSGLLAALEQGLAPLPESFVVARPKSAAQIAAVADIKSGLGNEIGPIREEIARLRTQSTPDSIVLDKPDPLTAVFVNWRALIAQICIALGIDLAALAILVLRMIGTDAGRRGDPPDDDGPPPGSLVCVDDLIAMEAMLRRLEGLRGPRKDGIEPLGGHPFNPGLPDPFKPDAGEGS